MTKDVRFYPLSSRVWMCTLPYLESYEEASNTFTKRYNRHKKKSRDIDDSNLNGIILIGPSNLIHSGADLHYKQALGALDSHIEAF